MNFGQKIQAGVTRIKGQTAGCDLFREQVVGGGWMDDDLEHKMRFGEKIRDGVKRSKEKAKEEGRIPWFDRERGVWGEVRVIDLIDDD
jgi:hypothetical protein